jgi:dihydropteroate synthase
VLVGASRKRIVGEIAGEPLPERRLMGTLGAHVAALARGARIFRVHDVRPHRQALDVAWRILHA